MIYIINRFWGLKIFCFSKIYYQNNKNFKTILYYIVFLFNIRLVINGLYIIVLSNINYSWKKYIFNIRLKSGIWKCKFFASIINVIFRITKQHTWLISNQWLKQKTIINYLAYIKQKLFLVNIKIYTLSCKKDKFFWVL